MRTFQRKAPPNHDISSLNYVVTPSKSEVYSTMYDRTVAAKLKRDVVLNHTDLQREYLCIDGYLPNRAVWLYHNPYPLFVQLAVVHFILNHIHFVYQRHQLFFFESANSFFTHQACLLKLLMLKSPCLCEQIIFRKFENQCFCHHHMCSRKHEHFILIKHVKEVFGIWLAYVRYKSISGRRLPKPESGYS
jgi:hypothetical protein